MFTHKFQKEEVRLSFEMEARTMNGSASQPVFANIPGATAIKDSWVLRNLDGFKRVKEGRPQSAAALLATRRNLSGTHMAPVMRENDDSGGQQNRDQDFRYTYDEMIDYEMDPYKVTSSPGMPGGQRIRPTTANDNTRYRQESAMGRTKPYDGGDFASQGITSPLKRVGSLKDKVSAAAEDMMIPVKNRGNHGATIVSATARRPDLPYLQPDLANTDKGIDPTPRGISPLGKAKHRIPDTGRYDEMGEEKGDQRLYLTQNNIPHEKQLTTGNNTKPMNYLLEADNRNAKEARKAELMSYQDETKRTCRFTAYFKEDRVWNTSAPIGNPVIETEVKRSLTIEYYVFDGTWSIYEKKLANLGIDGGKFLKRGKIVKDDDAEGGCLTIYDMTPGNTIRILGKEIIVTGADEGTYKFLEKNLGLNIRNHNEQHPPDERQDLGAHYAFGFGGKTFPPRTDNTFPPTYEFYQRREQNMKTRRFLFNDARPLRFNCLEISNRDDDGTISFDKYEEWKANGESGPIMITNATRLAVMTYYIQDYCLEISLGYWDGQVVQHQEAPLILKRSKIQKNWREATKGKKEPVFYEPHDFVCGEIADIYGRYYLLVGTDDSTRSKYLDMGHDQRQIEVEIEKIVPIERPIPKAGDGFLDIGAPEQTLATVYGQKKKVVSSPNTEKHRGRVLKGLAQLISKQPTDQGRRFNINFFMEDGHMSIFEEEVRNSGVVGGTYLSKGRWINHLPPEGRGPRYFHARDIFLGNVISVNKVEFQITELDGATLRFCEKNPDEFPMSDTFEILMRLLDLVTENALSLRDLCKGLDPRGRGFFRKDKFVDLLDAICVGGASKIPALTTVMENERSQVSQNSDLAPSIESENIRRLLNDHELLTVLRRFHAETTAYYHYDELCDMFSNFYFCRENNASAPPFGKTVYNLRELAETLRSSKVQWRRVFRKDIGNLKGTLVADHFISLMKKLGVRLSLEVVEELSAKYGVNENLATKIIEHHNRKLHKTANTAALMKPQASLAGGVSMGSVSSRSTVGSRSSIASNKGALKKGNTLSAGAATAVKGSNLDEMSVASVTVEGRRRQLQKTLPGVVRNATRRTKAKETVVKLDLGATVIDFHKLCDDIFVSEWAFPARS